MISKLVEFPSREPLSPQEDMMRALHSFYRKAFPVLVLVAMVVQRAPEFPGGGTGN